MLHFLAQHSILADGISIHIGDNVWSFSLNFIIYLIIAAIVGFVSGIYRWMETPVRFHRRDYRSPDRDLVDDSGHHYYWLQRYQCLWCSYHKSTDWRDNFCSIVAFNNLSFVVSTSSLLLPTILINQ